MNSRQLGRFTVPESELRRNPDTVAAVFALLGIVPVRAESLFSPRWVAYTAISPAFGEVPDGAEIPEYLLEVTRTDPLSAVARLAEPKCGVAV